MMPIDVADQDQSALASSSSGQAIGAASLATDLERRREIGQFFTPPLVAGFVWDLLEVIHGGRFFAKTRVIDPACGEGIFLRLAAERGEVAPDFLFGTDIDEALGRVWRHDRLLRSVHLFVGNGLLDLPDRGIQAGSFDVVVGNPPFAGKGLRDMLRLLDEPEGNSAPPESDLFGALVLQERAVPAGPPLKPQERAKLDQLAKELGRYACWRLSKDTENGEAETSSAGELGLGDNRKNGSDESTKAAEMVAAWPPNRLLDPKQPQTRFFFRKLASTAIDVFFMERFLRLAKPGGLIAVIVPESIVASDQLAPLRTWLLTELDLLAVVSLPQKVFAGVGANAKTSVVFARRLLRPRRAGEVAATAPEDDRISDAGESAAAAKVFMTAPNISAPDYSLERYLNDVLRAARAGSHAI